MNTPRADILLADDDRVDTKAFLRALAKIDIERQVTVARDGQEAWELLTGAAPLRPALIVLDINMPRLSGLELLRRIRGEHALRETPVFVLTTSDDEGDRLDALELNVAGYIVKADLAAGLRRALTIAG
ncbi:MAG: response regulator [Gammaproteobacteria bacterium]|nr:MAG: response regulator [Gammaproteobacteria bacterium]